MVAALGIAAGGLRAESRAAQVTLVCPATVQAGQQLVTGVAIDVGTTTALGAYSITVTYDPDVLTLASVAGGDTTEFSGKPTTNTPTPGTTNISAFQSASLTSPTGNVSVAMITFNVVATASGTTAIELAVNQLFDTGAVAIVPATGTGCSVSVTGPASTTTSTASTTTATTATSTTTPPPPTTTTTSSTSTTTAPSSTTTTRAPTTTMTSSTSTTTTTRPPTTTSTAGSTTSTTHAATTTTTTRPPTTTSAPSTTSTTSTSPTTSTQPPTTTSTSTTAPPTTTTTVPTSCQVTPTFDSIDCRLAALIAEVTAASDIGGVGALLLHELGRAKMRTEQAERLLAEGQTGRGRAAGRHAIRWMIGFVHRVGSLTGRRQIGTTTRQMLLGEGKSVLQDMQTLLQTVPTTTIAPATSTTAPPTTTTSASR